MILFTIAFLLGDLFLQLFAHLPSLFAILIIVVLSILFELGFYSIGVNKKWRWMTFACVLGFAFSVWYASAILSWIVPQEYEGKRIEVTGYIAALPVISNQQTHFLFELHTLKWNHTVLHHQTFIQLSWQQPLRDLQVGDKWHLFVKLKRIHGMQNPCGFDYEMWALHNGIRATGYVISEHSLLSNQELLSHHPYRYPIHFLRQQLQKKLNNYLPQSATSVWLKALIIGERSQIPQTEWQGAKRTGTKHLMAVAGLHIGLVAGFMHMFGSWMWRRIPRLLLWLPAQHAGAILACCAAIFYSALAGFSLPTQRACIMLSIFIFTLLWRLKINAWHVWSCALLMVLLFNPLQVLTDSFWLSFGTIALIIYGMGGRLAPTGWWWRFGRVQWVIGFGLIPFTLVLFQECSMLSFIANTIAIPWLTFFILPFCLLGSLFVMILPSFGVLLLFVADKSLSILWIMLTWLSELPVAIWHQSITNSWVAVSAVIAMLLLLLPAGFPGRWLGLFWLMPLIFFQPNRPATHHFWVTVLDVGQGLSVVVQTKSHTLIYDTGAKWSEGNDMGERIVLPYLRANHIKKIDKLVISHGDNDHIGGSQTILQSFPVVSIATSVVDRILPVTADYCLRGDTWQWDGVRFSFLYPSQAQLNLGNDSSCVLRIDNGKQSVLLTGDIEKFAEHILINTDEQRLASTILIAPHHGSKTSGLKQFIDAVHPTIVLYAMGYRNRYHFPHKSVMEAYHAIGARQFNSVESGAIQIKCDASDACLQPELYRIQHKRYWMG